MWFRAVWALMREICFLSSTHHFNLPF
jgi:hypothetical protein